MDTISDKLMANYPLIVDRCSVLVDNWTALPDKTIRDGHHDTLCFALYKGIYTSLTEVHGTVNRSSICNKVGRYPFVKEARITKHKFLSTAFVKPGV